MVFIDAKISTEKRQYGEFIWNEKYEMIEMKSLSISDYQERR
jgi:hypothetical protein